MPRDRRAAGTTPDRNIRLVAILEAIRGGLWFIPLTAVIGVSILAAILLQVDQAHPDMPAAFNGDASSARDLLSTIASSTLTMTTLVLSITIVALQLASQQFSPRVMRTFFRDTGTKVALGVFLATTVFALLVLREIVPEGTGRAEFVPDESVSVAFGLVLASLVAFVYYLNHVAHSIRAVHIMNAVAAETRMAIRDCATTEAPLARGEWPDRAPDARLASERAPGVVVSIDEHDVIELARQRGLRIRLVAHIGDFVPSGAPLADIWADEGDDPAIEAPDLNPLIGLGRERTMRQDVAFGFRQLVDMAEKALSPALNDPTTAVQALDLIHDLLRRLAVLPDPKGVFRDDDGIARLAVPVHGWDEMIHLAFDEIRQYGGSAFQVQRRMRATIDDLLRAVGEDPRRVAALEAQRDLLDRAAQEHFLDGRDRRWAEAADRVAGG